MTGEQLRRKCVVCGGRMAVERAEEAEALQAVGSRVLPNGGCSLWVFAEAELDDY